MKLPITNVGRKTARQIPGLWNKQRINNNETMSELKK